MPRVTLRHNLDEVPLTVAVVAEDLGVATSTLRTWERRYGLGPSARTVGSHRRYTALDVARLKHMRQLIDQGISPCDAARRVMTECLEELQVDYVESVPATSDTLIQAVCEHDPLKTQAMIERTVQEMGLVKSWQQLLRPAYEKCAQENFYYQPGQDPETFLTGQIMSVLQELLCRAPGICPDTSGKVLLVAGVGHEVETNILGAALRWEGICVDIVNRRHQNWGERLADYVNTKYPGVLAFIHAEQEDAQMIDGLDQVGLPIILVGRDLPCVNSPRVTRLQSMTAAVAEISEYLPQTR